MATLAIVMAGVATGFGALAVAHGLPWLWWPAASFGIVAVAYAANRPSIFGKDSAGRLAVVPQLVLLPYLLVMWAVWHAARRLSREAPYHDLGDGLFVGRRLLATELPDDIASVVDLTCELSAQLPDGRDITYRPFPVLDGFAPSARALLDEARCIAKLPRPLYVHCAYGHGRAVMMAAAILRVDGASDDAIAALDRVCEVRPNANPSGTQRRTLRALERLLSE